MKVRKQNDKTHILATVSPRGGNGTREKWGMGMDSVVVYHVYMYSLFMYYTCYVVQ